MPPARPTACPSCASEKWRPAFRLRGLQIWRCGKCRLLAYNPEGHKAASPDEFAGLDLDTYFEAMAPIRRESSRRLLEQIEQHIAPGKILDIGCSFGWFLDEARRRGWETFGIEPSDIAVRQAIEAGHDVLHGTFPEQQHADQKFDAVIMMDVLEHLPHGVEVLAQIRRILRPGGLLILKVPNREGIIYRTARVAHVLSAGMLDLPSWRLWQMDFPYPHTWYFDPRTLRRTVRRAGFQPILSDVEPIVTLGSIKSRMDYIAATGSALSRGLVPLYRAGLTACVMAANLTGAHDIAVLISRRPEKRRKPS
ncbi:class I SAM-dependent methyltransferase [bacterium]|nr:class I SAM-dependent methyltransferase [bacterium]